ncbi:hypothetical protein C5O80_37465 [Burkholderia sp. SRS-46]|nr:hypothetical protein C5O80_37465 [Burkholderia sp. SRS-46]
MSKLRSALVAGLACTVIAALPLGTAYAKKGQSKWPVTMGEVTEVTASSNTFAIKDADGHITRFKTTPDTEFETERERPVKFSWTGSFADIQPGRWVRVKYFGSTETKVARDVDVFLYGQPTP